jgi:branched-chain amino acid transport system ATP-binding protein
VAVLEIEHLGVDHGLVPAVRDVSMCVEAGEIVALLGANGAGKTTTLLAISNLARRKQGRISVAGTDTLGLAPHQVARLGVAHVPEGRGLISRLTVRENLRLAPRRQDLGPVGTWFPELDALMGRRAGLLSGGEQQMLALARAFLGRPRLLLVDEPSLGLAPVVVERLLGTLRQIANEAGTAVVVVEQDPALALSFADRGHVIRQGEVVLSGAAADLGRNAAALTRAYLGDT